MSTFEDLKAAFKRRLLAATHKHLLGHLETTISGYEKELERKRKLVETIRKRRAGGFVAAKLTLALAVNTVCSALHHETCQHHVSV